MSTPTVASNLIAASTASSPAAIQSAPINIPQSELDDLKSRLRNTRWPSAQPVTNKAVWTQGVPLHILKHLTDYWLNKYDWRRCESLLNSWSPQSTVIDGLRIHFYHIKSTHTDALPLLITHGWPGSILEFRHCIPLLTNPASNQSTDAFHVVLPSLPGYGWSEQPSELGWDAIRVASAWSVLMKRLGYENYVAQGGDWGAQVTTRLAQQQPAGLLAIHINSLYLTQPPTLTNTLLPPSTDEQSALRIRTLYTERDSGYKVIQSTRPQTLGYALADSPVGQLAWIYDKLHEWTDRGQGSGQGNEGHLPTETKTKSAETVLRNNDEILDNITLYWLSNTATSSARFYWENGLQPTQSYTISAEMPVCVSQFMNSPVERATKQWCDYYYKNVAYWNEIDTESGGGGHFAAWEKPDILVNEVCKAFRPFRKQ